MHIHSVLKKSLFIYSLLLYLWLAMKTGSSDSITNLLISFSKIAFSIFDTLNPWKNSPFSVQTTPLLILWKNLDKYKGEYPYLLKRIKLLSSSFPCSDLSLKLNPTPTITGLMWKLVRPMQIPVWTTAFFKKFSFKLFWFLSLLF